MNIPVRFKSGVKIQGIAPEILLAIHIVSFIVGERVEELVITSVRDGTHSPNSKHKLGYAMDIRSRDFRKSELEQVRSDIEEALTDEFFVSLEDDHFHIQFNGGFL